MTIQDGWMKKTEPYLKLAIENFLTANGITPVTGSSDQTENTVVLGGNSFIAGTFAQPKIYILARDGYPKYDKHNVLWIGYRIKFFFTEVQLSDAMEQLTSALYSLTEYLEMCVHCVSPIITNVKPSWIAMTHDEPDFPFIYDIVKKSYNANEVNLDVAFRIGASKYGWNFPQGGGDYDY